MRVFFFTVVTSKTTVGMQNYFLLLILNILNSHLNNDVKNFIAPLVDVKLVIFSELSGTL